jgi:hypothetical protein
MAFAHYTIDGRTFDVMFSYNTKTQAVHINSLMGGQDSNVNIPFSELMQKFASDVCSKFGPINPQQITYQASQGPLKGREDGSAVRDRLFQRYIRQFAQNMPPACSARTQNPIHHDIQPKMMRQAGKYDSHPLRGAFRGSDEEFARLFGL